VISKRRQEKRCECAEALYAVLQYSVDFNDQQQRYHARCSSCDDVAATVTRVWKKPLGHWLLQASHFVFESQLEFFYPFLLYLFLRRQPDSIAVLLELLLILLVLTPKRLKDRATILKLLVLR